MESRTEKLIIEYQSLYQGYEEVSMLINALQLVNSIDELRETLSEVKIVPREQ